MNIFNELRNLDLADLALQRKRYFFIPIKLFDKNLRHNISQGHARYCMNKAIENALEFIGEYRGTNKTKNVKSDYRKGIDFICRAYRERFNEPLYVAEVKRLVRPNRKHRKDDPDQISQSGHLKVPYKLMRILSCIADHIDIPKDAMPLTRCKNCRNKFCQDNGTGQLYCYHYLAFELYNQLLDTEGYWSKKAKMAKECRELINNKKRCK